MSSLDTRVRRLNDCKPRREGRYLLYWIQANRRAGYNQALEWAVRKANELGLPLLVYEGLTCSYPHANDRLHTFVLEGVPELAAAFADRGIGYFFYLRQTPSDRNDVLYRLAEGAAAVITDDFPAFVVKNHNDSVAKRLGIPFHAVDASCIVPMNVHEKRAWAAYTIRPKIHRELPNWLVPFTHEPDPKPWQDDLLPADLLRLRTQVTASNIARLVAECAIDHSIPVSERFRGGAGEAHKRLGGFLDHRLARYARESNQPSKQATSDLSPYLHFGHISALEVALAAKAHAEEHKLIASEFLEELIVRRELAFNFARYAANPETLAVLPDWCLKTIEKHRNDPRPFVYRYQEFAEGRTHDALWNATQREMLRHGKIHGYYRMYWGKKIMEWSASLEDALATMIRIHDIWSLDGRDPNTYTNILWCFGLHDRPWTERPIFGQLRYMSLDGMRRKTDTEAYIREMEGTQPRLL